MKVFISYRREDSRHAAGRLYQHLRRHMADADIFLDVDGIPVGVDFRKHIRSSVEACDVLVAIIGSRWLTGADGAGTSRLDDPNDFVRIEIEAALAKDVPIVPVLLDEARMPGADALPESLRPLTFRQAAKLRADPDFDGDAERLVAGLLKLGKSDAAPRAKRSRPMILTAMAAAVVAMAVVALALRAGQFDANGPQPSPPIAEVQRACYFHNGSKMELLVERDASFQLRYLDPDEIARHGVRVGTVLVDGQIEDGRAASATARAFYRGCQPLEFRVNGPLEAGNDIQLQGLRPLRNVRQEGCPLTGTERAASLTFDRVDC